MDEYQKFVPQCLVSVNGIPLIKRIIRQISDNSFNKVTIVVGYEGEKVQEYIEGIKDNLTVEYIKNFNFDNKSIIFSLYEAKNILQQDDTIIIESSLIIDNHILCSLKENNYNNLIVVDEYERWMDGMKVQIDEEGAVINFIPRDVYDRNVKRTYYKTLDIFRFSKEYSSNRIIPFVDAFVLSEGGTDQFEDILQILSLVGNNELKSFLLNENKWYSIKDKQDLDIAEALFADEKDVIKKYYGRYGGYWRFPKMLNYCFLENPFFNELKIKSEIEDNIQILITSYPSGMAINTLLASKCWNVKEMYIVPGNGASELINVLLGILKGSFGIIRPTFEEYPNRLQNSQVVTYIPQNDNYRYDTDDLIEFFTKNPADNIVLINPDNPTGNFITKRKMLNFAKWCEIRQTKLIVDESFIDYSEDASEGTLLTDELLESNKNLIVIKSISKSLGASGIRLGILCSANTDLIIEIKSKISIWNINSLAEYLMQILNKYEDECQRMYNKVVEERKLFVSALKKIAFLRVIPTQANFILCEVFPPFNARELVILLLKRYNILIRDCTGKLGLDKGEYIRLTIRNHNDNQRLLEAFNLICNDI